MTNETNNARRLLTVDAGAFALIIPRSLPQYCDETIAEIPQGLDDSDNAAHLENAQRLAACWNACAGFNLETLQAFEPGALSAMFARSLQREPAAPGRVVHALRDALSGCVDELELHEKMATDTGDADLLARLESARDALALDVSQPARVVVTLDGASLHVMADSPLQCVLVEYLEDEDEDNARAVDVPQFNADGTSDYSEAARVAFVGVEVSPHLVANRFELATDESESEEDETEPRETPASVARAFASADALRASPDPAAYDGARILAPGESLVGMVRYARDLESERYSLVLDSQDIGAIIESLDAAELARVMDGGNVTGALVAVENGDYSEVWVSDSSRPFELGALYACVRDSRGGAQ